MNQIRYDIKIKLYYPDFKNNIQSNFSSSDTDGSLIVANSNSIFNPYEIFPIAQDKKTNIEGNVLILS